MHSSGCEAGGVWLENNGDRRARGGARTAPPEEHRTSNIETKNMNHALSLFLKLFGPKLVRHAIAWFLGVLAAHNLQVDSSNIGALLVTLAGSLAVVVWSVAAKSQPSDDLKEKLKDFTGALVSNSLPMLLGYLNTKGVDIDGHTDLVTTGLALLNFAKSAAVTPDVTAGSDKLKLPIIALLSASALLTSCDARALVITDSKDLADHQRHRALEDGTASTVSNNNSGSLSGVGNQ